MADDKQLRSEFETLRHEHENMRVDITGLKLQITNVNERLAETKKRLDDVVVFMDLVRERLVGNMAERGIVVKQQDTERDLNALKQQLTDQETNTAKSLIELKAEFTKRLDDYILSASAQYKDLQDTVKKLWDDRLKLIGASAALAGIVPLLFELGKILLLPHSK